MGSNGSKSKKYASVHLFGKDAKQSCGINLNVSSMQKPNDNRQFETTLVKVPPNLGPLITRRYGSMYFDEDGDLAHEFYVEVKEGRKRRMKRVYENLTPQVRFIFSILQDLPLDVDFFHILGSY